MTRTLTHAYSCYNLKLYVCLSYGVTLAFWLAGASMGHDAPMIAGLAAPVLV
ncbi:MAG: hypothetical protein GVY29_12200, partial [Spirochaetes bacterium]|nr:hypothetical protein [Spirochaetota bacterium]